MTQLEERISRWGSNLQTSPRDVAKSMFSNYPKSWSKTYTKFADFDHIINLGSYEMKKKKFFNIKVDKNYSYLSSS